VQSVCKISSKIVRHWRKIVRKPQGDKCIGSHCTSIDLVSVDTVCFSHFSKLFCHHTQPIPTIFSSSLPSLSSSLRIIPVTHVIFFLTTVGLWVTVENICTAFKYFLTCRTFSAWQKRYLCSAITERFSSVPAVLLASVITVSAILPIILPYIWYYKTPR